MAILSKVILKIDDYEVELFNLSYSFNRKTDELGRPVGNVKGGKINIICKSIYNRRLLEWTISGNLSKDCVIQFIDNTDNITSRIFLKDAHCLSYNLAYNAELFNTSIEELHKYGEKESITLSCKNIVFDNNGIKTINWDRPMFPTVKFAFLNKKESVDYSTDELTDFIIESLSIYFVKLSNVVLDQYLENGIQSDLFSFCYDLKNNKLVKRWTPPFIKQNKDGSINVQFDI